MILAYKGTSIWPSKMIEWMSWSEYSHIAWLCNNGRVIEAWPPKVRVTKNLHDGHTKGTPVDVFSLNITQKERQAVENFLLSKVDLPYDWESVFRFLPRRQESARSKEKWFCSVLVFMALAQVGIHLLYRVEPYQVTPGMIVHSPLLEYEKTFIVGEETNV